MRAPPPRAIHRAPAPPAQVFRGPDPSTRRLFLPVRGWLLGVDREPSTVTGMGRVSSETDRPTDRHGKVGRPDARDHMHPAAPW